MKSTQSYYTLEYLEKRQQALQQQMQSSRQRISYTWRQLFEPPKADTKVQRWVNQAERAVAVYDGFMMMYKLFHRFSVVKGVFKKKKK